MKHEVDLDGETGNAYWVMAFVREAMSSRPRASSKIVAYTQDAMSSDYGHLLDVSRRWVTIKDREPWKEVNDMPAQGDRVRLIRMTDPYDPVAPGT